MSLKVDTYTVRYFTLAHTFGTRDDPGEVTLSPKFPRRNPLMNPIYLTLSNLHQQPPILH